MAHLTPLTKNKLYICVLCIHFRIFERTINGWLIRTYSCPSIFCGYGLIHDLADVQILR